MSELPLPEPIPPEDQPLGPPPVAARKPRIWTVFVVPVAVDIVAIIVSGILLMVGISITNSEVGQLFTDPDKSAEFEIAITDFTMTPVGLAVMLYPQALTFFAVVCAGLLSPIDTTIRLGLSKPRIGIVAIFAVLAAMPFFGMLGDLLMRFLMGGPSDHLLEMERMVQDATPLMVVFIAIGISVLPGVAEEFMFRGYVQQRLLQRWNPTAAIGVSALFFAGSHLDPAHVIAVIPMGLWLGFVAWLSGSIWPSVACHAASNLLSVILSRTMDIDPADDTWDTPSIVLFSISGVAVLCSLILMRRDLRVSSSDIDSDLPQHIARL